MKKLVQFNELVFNHTAYIDQQPDNLTEFKNSKNAFANSHGDYSPERCGPRKVNSKQFDVTVMVDKNKFPCEDREVIEQFVLDNFFSVGRLWAVQGDFLLWSLAKVLSISEGFDEKRGYLSFTVTFYLPEGIWHIADDTATYFDDYYQCDVTDCYAALERELCDCCVCNIKLAPIKRCPPCHGDRLCDIPKGELSEVIGNCGNNKKISYSCCDQTATAETKSEYGSNTAFLQFEGKTLYETEDVVLEICGKFTDLGINWNGQQSIIEGAYIGETIINAGLVKNNCDYLDISKFHGDCVSNAECTPPDCSSNDPKIGVTGSSNGIVSWSVKKGTNNVILSGLDTKEIQTIKVFVGGIAL
ncbi:hypothetical protein [Enterococcus pallens]|uniref:Uncharacterized protein n=1 Tax=Enterococcus pallens ATCC BAA-351 TaxID=1158607 RepID=R2PTN8_9ENTE|nr:hypothetical protein [Enterococcus pallens]EOH86693.1 hypothetical protein UAU_05138 [Enterococcus pallens ATCC BAA-351]EOU18489.1 hypothetical protein I588_03483 [Enterococcus pallens ATCC BAA-351]